MSVLRSLKLKKLELLTQAKEAATSPRLKPDFASPALNLSSTVFSENEIELLKKGKMFAITPISKQHIRSSYWYPG